MQFQLRPGQLGDRLVHVAQHPGQRLDDLHLDARADQGLRRLQADVPGAHHGGPAHRPGVEEAAQLDRFVQGTDREDPGVIETRHRRPHRVSAAGDDQCVIADRLAPARAAEVDPARLRVDPADAGAEPQVDAAFLAELRRRVGEQALRVRDGAAQEVRDPAHAVGGEAARLADDHVEGGCHPARGRGGRHPRGATADHDEPCHLLPSTSHGPSAGIPGRAINAGHERACGSAPAAVRSCRDKEPAQARPARPVAPAA